MNIKILGLIIGFFCSACSQKKEVTMITQNPNITAKNLVEEITKNIKHYPSEKVYTLDFISSYNFFELFVNDMPLHKEFRLHSSSSATELNPRIFKSGKYKVVYKMHPVGQIDNENYPVLRDNSYLDITLTSYDLKNENSSDIIYNHYKTPVENLQISKKYSEDKFIGTGKDYYEGSFYIDVQVPYEIHPTFDKGKDLRKMDKKELEVKLLSAYQKVWNIYQNKEYDNIAKISFDALKDEFVTKFNNKNNISEVWKTYLESYNESSFEMQPLKDYKLEFFSNGKLVALMSTNPDFRNRGNTALWAKVNQEGLRPFFINRYFYIPENETEFKVY
ncbi:hypothetical protein BWK59_14125 [Flavobacterium davisii]|uniref:Uncharacterized protein n=1 Tax=Flavobacterium davisii TaxID=2906077 RepID=A0A2D0AIA6_9FLAO|nr:hypothetical protein [Flavobacterium davisii]OWP82767.1 hypothetical protein BWK59_14125 [Flavobacterium davisii]